MLQQLHIHQREQYEVRVVTIIMYGCGWVMSLVQILSKNMLFREVLRLLQKTSIFHRYTQIFHTINYLLHQI